MTHDPAPGSTPGLVVCVGLPSDQIIEIARLLRGQATVLATPDVDGARAVLGNQGAPRRPGDVPWHGLGAQPERFDNPGPADERPPGRHLSERPADRLPDNPTGAAGRVTTDVLATPLVADLPRPGTGPLPTVTGSIPMVAPPTLDPLVAGPLLVDLAGREVTALGRRVYLSAREFDLLATLALEAGRVWSFAELTARVWRLPYLGDSDPVTSAVKRLRKRLAPVRDVEVASVRGVGYRLKIWA
ncbi:winged helix-turn-helix domain-containing protein [Promicromonospora kroppenstedtii]|uniref:Winged helix-turn-helix domain-containing protein n=1 Tax=Promicromonospora kroppenstedtii TaxID=440482 RepID=A0ABW7XIG1_9MICO